jgi:hypothetical protein
MIEIVLKEHSSSVEYATHDSRQARAEQHKGAALQAVGQRALTAAVSAA